MVRLLAAPFLALILLSCGAAGRPSASHVGSSPCVTVSASVKTVSPAVDTSVALIGNAFDVAVTPDGKTAFASLANGRIAVIDLSPDPKLTRGLASPATGLSGLALSRDGNTLYATDGRAGLIIFDAARAATQESAAMTAHISGPPIDGSATLVVLSADERFAFVSLEKADAVAVFDLEVTRRSGYARSGLVGLVPVGTAPVGLALSPDGRTLYATSELAAREADHGTLSVIDVPTAEREPASAVVATVPAGCGPVRVAASPDGRTVWVTARESNALLAFSAAALREDPASAFLTSVLVGPAPVALAVAGDRVYVADSDRRATRPTASDVVLIDARDVANGKLSILGAIPTGRFPRALAFTSDGRLLVADFTSSQLEVVQP